MMPHTLIIGYGNPLRGDDGFGWHAALRLREIVHDADIEILAVHQLTPELMDPISRARRVIFIDAAVGEDAGKLTVAPLETTGSLYRARPEALLITVVGLDFEIGADLSEPVQLALESLAGTKIRELLAGPPPQP
jgi:Ni,Fe-hydrogenase maturation factor